MEIKELAFKIEELTNKAKVINSFQEVFFQAIFRGEPLPDNYEWAYAEFCQITESMAQNMETLQQCTFKLLKELNY